jgi:phosphoglycolate phosphatase
MLCASAMISTVLVDLDGTILEGRNRHYGCYSEILAEHGMAPLSIDDYWRIKRSGSSNRDVLKATGAEDLHGSFAQQWHERIEEKKYLVLDEMHDRAIDVLHGWKQGNIKVVLVTLRNNRDNLLWQLGHLSIASLFHSIATVTSYGSITKSEIAKPFVSDTAPANMIWIGDTEADVTAGREIGAKTCAVECGLRTAAFLERLSPDILESSLYSLRKNRGEEFGWNVRGA